MKKILNFIKAKFLMFILALVLPLSATGFSISLLKASNADAATNGRDYHTSYMSEVSLTNSNFDSSSTTSLRTSISGWTSQNANSNTTAGVINVGTSFQNNMSSYHLSVNPLAKAADKQVLMINSQVTGSSAHAVAQQGYKSSEITLSANGYYSFSASFKSDTNYESYTDYVELGVVSEANRTIPSSTFIDTNLNNSFTAPGEKTYIAFTYSTNVTYYLAKELTAASALGDEVVITNNTNATDNYIFYTDENFVGFMHDGNALYISKEDLPDAVEADGHQTYTLGASLQTYTCNLEYDPSAKNYRITGQKYYDRETKYTSLDDFTFGSIYLSGLKDDDGNELDVKFSKINSKDWTTYTFYVATGANSQSVNLELWLGGKENGNKSSGVVFFDDVHLYQHTSTSFWNLYKANANKKYTQEIKVGGSTIEKTYDATNLVNLQKDNALDYSTYNFDFEDVSNDITGWTTSGNGNARIFDVNDPTAFKAATGQNFVGSPLTCIVDIEAGEVTITPNRYVLALWANDQKVRVTSQDLLVEANAVYKVTASYKVGTLSGNAYMFVSENDNVLADYNITSNYYKVADEVASSALNSNGDNEFNNKYNTIEFYIKGNTLFDSSVNISLGLGNGEATATGLVVFDNIKIEKTNSTEFANASTKISLGSEFNTTSVTNGNFNTLTISDEGNAPFAPDSWTIDSSEEITFGGVINSSQRAMTKYIAKYNEIKDSGVVDAENPYVWAYYLASSPKNAYGSTEDSDNVLMLANLQNAWQKVSTPSVTISSGSKARFAFSFKGANIKFTILGKNGTKLYEEELNSAGTWMDYSVVFNASGEETISAEITFGTQDDKVSGFAFFDNFIFKSSISDSIYDNAANKVDMTNFYMNLPTNEITDELETSVAPAYTGEVVTGNADSNRGGVVLSDKFADGDPFHIDGDSQNVFFFNNQSVGGYRIQSNYSIKLSSGYHLLTFKVKTNFVKAKNELDSTKKYNYGLTAGLTNFNYLKNIRCDEDFETYSIYIHASSDTTAELYLSFTSDTNDTLGSAVLYDINIEDTDSDTYKAAETTCKAKNYDANDGKVFVAKASEASEDDDNENENEKNDSPARNNDLNWSLIVSGAITGLAIVLAVILLVFRNIKIKKIEIKRRENYDRKTSVEYDIARKKAENQVKAEVKALEEDARKMKAELDRLEKDHKEKVVALRAQDKGKVSKETDRAFKDYARKRAVIAEKVDSINKKIEETKSPDYLLGLERKIYTQDATQKRNLEKTSKAENKKADKANKK